MKKTTPKKSLKKTSDNFISNLGTSKEIVIAIICVLVIFFVALMASMSRKPGTQQLQTLQKEIRNGNQSASISILPPEIPRTAQLYNVPTGETFLQPGSSAAGMAADHGEMNAGAIPAGKRVVFKIENFKKLATQPLKFNVYDEQGRELTPDYLRTENDYKIHFIIVSADFRNYEHLHPNYLNGVWNVSALMKQPGTYYTYVDIVPVKGKPAVLRNALIVREASKDPKYPGLSSNLTAVANDIQAVLTPTPSLSSTKAPLTFTLSRNGKPVNDVRPYLGAFGHVVLLKHGSPDSYVHLHPLEVADESKGMFQFMPSFSGPGVYTAFAEFKIGKKIIIFPITFELK